MSNERLWANIDFATTLLQFLGHAKGSDPEGVCLVEALHYATIGVDSGAGDEYHEALQAVADAIGIPVPGLAAWNDAEERTIDDLYVAFGKAKLLAVGSI
jgi:hypothetical protein